MCYGCGNNANFILKNKKHCCSEYITRCPAIKIKNSVGVKSAHMSGKLNGWSELSRAKANVKKIEIAVNQAFERNSRYNNEDLKRYMVLYKNISNECHVCNITEWNNKPITLELDHIDGDSRNNELSNLQLLCPNCHSQTNTFRGRNINNGSKKVSDETLIKEYNKTKSIHKTLINCSLAPKGANYKRMYKLVYDNLSTQRETSGVNDVKFGETSLDLSNGNPEPSL